MALLSDMPVVIFAGGRGSRFNSETEVLPKPLIEVAGKPILQHIIDGFVAQGFNRFVIPVGYLGQRIMDYMERTYGFSMSQSDLRGNMTVWYGSQTLLVVVRETGESSHTGERLYRLRDLIGDRRFVLTYGDGLSGVQMSDVVLQHDETEATVTVTAVHPPGRFGVMEFYSTMYEQGYLSQVCSFEEKASAGWINGGFMVCEPRFIPKYLGDDLGTYRLEQDALPVLARHGGLHAFKWEGYWACMDTRRDLEQIEADVAAAGGRLPWRRDTMEEP